MDTYDLTSGRFVPQLSCVNNLFIQQIYQLSVKSAQNSKMVEIITKNFVSNRGEIANKNLSADEKSIINVCNLTPLVDTEHCSNLVEDIAQYRWEHLGLEGDALFWKKHSTLLFLDYILSSCLCYVEVFENGSNGKRSNMVDKFYATRNRFVAASVAGIPVGETGKYTNYLTPVYTDYQMESLRVLKLSKNKKGYKISQPRSAISFKKAVKITPVFMITAFLQGITPILKENIVRFKYIKDNTQERELYTTLSASVLEKYYDKNYAENILRGCELKLDRGYIKVPEVGCSKYDETGMRALNISRITSIEVVNDVDTSYIDVDFNGIIPTFKGTLECIKDLEVVHMIYQTLLHDVPKDNQIMSMKSDILAYIEGRFAIGTSTFQKELHNYMMQYNKVIFKGYTGKPTSFSLGAASDNFNLGVEE